MPNLHAGGISDSADRVVPAARRDARSRAATLVVFLWVLDLILIAFDILRHRGLLHDARFAVTTERGFGECFQYLKSAAVASLLLGAWRQTTAAAAWGGLFLYLLLDDAFELHERGGRHAATSFGLPTIGSVRPEQLGELLVYGIVGLSFASVLAILLRRRDRAARTLSVSLAPAFAVLVFFGAVVDLLHSVLGNRAYRYAAGVVEDGGEMLAMSVLVGIAYWATRPPRPGGPAGR